MSDQYGNYEPGLVSDEPYPPQERVAGWRSPAVDAGIGEAGHTIAMPPRGRARDPRAAARRIGRDDDPDETRQPVMTMILGRIGIITELALDRANLLAHTGARLRDTADRCFGPESVSAGRPGSDIPDAADCAFGQVLHALDLLEAYITTMPAEYVAAQAKRFEGLA